MNFTPEQVDLIVQRVVEQLGTASAASVPSQVPARSNATVGPNAAAAVRITAQVITRDLLEESVAGAATVRLAPKAILTPSARDFLRAGRPRRFDRTTTANLHDDLDCL